jgi:hypothetical protein
VPCYRATPRFASRLPLALRERCFSPTSATDFPLRAPLQIAGFPSPAACAAMTSHRERNGPRPASAFAAADAGPPCGNPTPDELALDGARRASVLSIASRPSPWGEAAGRAQFSGLPYPPRRCRPRTRPTKETSDTPCRAPTYVPGSRPTPSSRNQDRFHHPRVNADGFPGPECLPSTSAREALSRPPSPPPIARLCRRAPASDAASPPRCSRAGGLDLDHGFPRRSSRQGWCRPRVARRLLQS